MRGWIYEQNKKIFPGGSGTGSSDGHAGMFELKTRNAGEALPSVGIFGFADDAVVSRESGMPPSAHAMREIHTQDAFFTTR